MSKQRHFLYISIGMFISEQLSEMKDIILCRNFDLCTYRKLPRTKIFSTIVGRYLSNITYADDTLLMSDTER